MFIVKYKDGTQVTSENLTWDDIESTDENHITAIHLTLPFRAQTANADGTFTELPARTVSLTGYHRWYYGKEATAGFIAPNGLDPRHAVGVDVAEIVGGIDDRAGVVFQVRVAKDGNITTNRFPSSALVHSEETLRKGIPSS